MIQSFSEVMAKVESRQNRQRSIGACVPRPMIEQLLESEIVFKTIALTWAVHSRQISR